MAQTKQIIGFLVILLTIGTGVTYFYFNDQVSIRIDEDKAVFYTNVEGRYLISAQQNDRLFSGTNIIDRVKKTIELTNSTQGSIYTKQRSTEYKNGEKIVHTWTFDPYSPDIADFPLIEKICIYNAKGKFYRYSLDKLVDAGPKRKLTTETSASFGRNIKIDFQAGYRWGWIGYPYGSDSFAVQYDIKSNEECFDIRLFDPIATSMCYQESANVSTICGGLDNGSYTIVTDSFFIHYYKPENSTENSLWMVKHGDITENVSVEKCWSYDHLLFQIESKNTAGSGSFLYCYNGTQYVSIGTDQTNASETVDATCADESYKLWDGDWSTRAAYYTSCNKWQYKAANALRQSEIYEEAMYWNITSGTEDINISFKLSGYEKNITAEVGSTINLSANITTDKTVCIDIDHPEGGTNVNCGTNSTQYDFNLTYYFLDKFNDSTEEKNITYVNNFSLTTPDRYYWAGLNWTTADDTCNESREFVRYGTIESPTSCWWYDGSAWFITQSYLYNKSFQFDNNYSTCARQEGSNFVSVLANSWAEFVVNYYANNVEVHTKDGSHDVPDNCVVDGKITMGIMYNGTGSPERIYCFPRTGYHIIATGTNASCGYNITYSTTDTFYIDSYETDTIFNLSLNMTGYNNGGGFPSETKIYINETLVEYVGTLFNVTTFTESEFFDNTTVTNASYLTESTQTIASLYLPKSATITASNIKIKGYKKSQNCYQETTNQYHSRDDVCGQDYLGSYRSEYNTWTIGTPGPWAFNTKQYVYMNYTIPTNSTDDTRWLVKHGNSSPYYINLNETNCWNSSLFQGRIWAAANSSSNVQCWNSTGWETIGTLSTVDQSTSCQSLPGKESRVYDGNWDVGAFSASNNGGFRNCTNRTINNPLASIWEEAMNWSRVSYPYSVEMEVGIVDGESEFSEPGYFNYENTTNITESVQAYLDICEEDGFGYCEVPIFITSERLGIIEVSDLEINYTYQKNPITIDGEDLEDYIETKNGITTIPINIKFEDNGTVKIEDMKLLYLGGRFSLNVTAHNDDCLNNITRLITYQYDVFNRTLPYTWTDKIFYQPKTYDSKNVSAFSQTSSSAIFNFSSYARDYNFNISALIINTTPCLNITLSTTENKSDGVAISNGSYAQMFQINSSSNKYLWSWADLNNCNSSVKKYLQPQFSFKSCCEDCEVCE